MDKVPVVPSTVILKVLCTMCTACEVVPGNPIVSTIYKISCLVAWIIGLGISNRYRCTLHSKVQYLILRTNYTIAWLPGSVRILDCGCRIN